MGKEFGIISSGCPLKYFMTSHPTPMRTPKGVGNNANNNTAQNIGDLEATQMLITGETTSTLGCIYLMEYLIGVKAI